LNIGIDVSKSRLDVAIRPTSEQFFVTNDEAGHKELRRRLTKLKPERITGSSDTRSWRPWSRFSFEKNGGS
jgi:transposase